MTRIVNSGLEGVPSEGLPVLHHREKARIVKSVTTAAFSPQTVAAFTGATHELPFRKARKVVDYATFPPLLAAESVISEAAVILARPDTYLGPDLPPVLGALVDSLARFTPGQLVASSPAAAEALPSVLAASFVAKALVSLRPEVLPWQMTRLRRQAAKNLMVDQVKDGTMRWKDIFGIAYTGDGSNIYDSLRKLDSRNYCEIVFEKKAIEPLGLPTVNTVLPENTKARPSRPIYRRAGALTAEVLLQLPTSNKSEIVTDAVKPESYAYGVARAGSCTLRFDEIRDAAGRPRIPVLMIADPDQPLDYSYYKNGKGNARIIHQTLGSYMEKAEKDRGAAIEVMDATRPVIDEIIELAEQRPIHLLTTALNTGMQQRFYKGLKSYRPKTYLSPVVLILNDSDRSTEHAPTVDVGSNKQRIVVLKEPDRAAGVIDSGVPARNVLIAPEIIARTALGKIDRLISEPYVTPLSPDAIGRLAASLENSPLRPVLHRARQLADNHQNR